MKKYEFFAMDESDDLTKTTKTDCLSNERLRGYLSTLNADYLNRYDMLTGLPNRQYFMQFAPSRLEEMREAGESPVVLYLNYSNLKAFNSRYGFGEGDRLLSETGELLSDIFGRHRSSRFESDHFFICAARDGAEERLEKLFSRAKDINGGRTLPFRVGIYDYEYEEVSLSEACDRAKTAESTINGEKKSTFVVFDRKIMEMATLKQYVLQSVQRAIDKRWIKVYCQPVIRSMTGSLCGLEALARWEDPVYGMISPGQFIPVLEESGQVVDLDLYIWEEVCRIYHNLIQKHINVVPISVNLSRKDFEHGDLVDRIERIARTYDVPREMLNIEVTESAFVENVYEIGRAIERLHELGYQVWMDDFGSGYSSLGILKDFCFDELKIDMSFLSSYTDRARTIIESVVRMAKEIGIQTLAEGVETEEQYQFLRKIGCEKIQGYYFGKPMPGKIIGRYCREKGIPEELPKMRNYYDSLGRVNYLKDGPLCVIEDDGENMRVLYMNDAYRNVLKRDLICDLRAWEKRVNSRNSVVGDLYRRFADLQLRKDNDTHTLTYPSGDHYIQITGSKVASYKNRCIYEVELRYIEIREQSAEQKNAEYLSNLYHICDHISLIDFSEDTIENLKNADTEKQMSMGGKINGIREAVELWKTRQTYTLDQRRFLAFADPETMRERMEKSERHMLCGQFRNLTANGEYRWYLHVLLPIPGTGNEKILVATIRTELTEDLMKEILSDSDTYVQPGSEADSSGREEMTPAVLWETLTGYGSEKLFWKDRERRFAGVSESFKEYYGIKSDTEILGKTDEDMHWHVEGEAFENDELTILQEGKHIRNMFGTCIVRGRQRPIAASKGPVFRDGRIVGLMGYFQDLGDIRKMAVDYEQEKELDAVTKTANVRGLCDSLHSYLRALWEENRNFAIIGITIPEYETFYEMYGDEAGDELLRRIARILSSIAGNESVTGRVDGSRFYLLYQYKDKTEAAAVGSRIRGEVESVRSVGDWNCACTAKIRITYMTRENADINMYQKLIAGIISNFGETEEL